jgi:hypothetical protein
MAFGALAVEVGGFWRVGIRVGLSRRIFRVVEEPSAWGSSRVRTLDGSCLVGFVL